MQHIRRKIWVAFARKRNIPLDLKQNVMIRARYEWREWLINTTPYPIEFGVADNGYTLSIKFKTEADKIAFLLKWS